MGYEAIWLISLLSQPLYKLLKFYLGLQFHHIIIQFNISYLEKRLRHLQSLKKFFFPVSHVGSQFLDQGSNPHPLHWKYRVLTIGQSGKSLTLAFCCVMYLQQSFITYSMYLIYFRAHLLHTLTLPFLIYRHLLSALVYFFWLPERGSFLKSLSS